MTSTDAVLVVLDALEASAIPYMLVGSFSSNFYGIGRSTADADFVLQLSDHNLSDLVKRLGPEFNLDPQMAFEVHRWCEEHGTRDLLDEIRMSLPPDC